MAVRSSTRRGKRKLIIDIPYRRSDGVWDRYRRDSKAATLAAAREEERRVRDLIARTGSPFESAPGDEDASRAVLFKEVVEEFVRSYTPSQLKFSTRKRYERLLETVLVPRFGAMPIEDIDATASRRLDAELAESVSARGGKLKRSTRNNVQIALRSVLRYALEAGHIKAFPQLPPLKRVGRQVVKVMSDGEVDRVMAAAGSAHRLSFMLAAYAGLRANEVRGLRWSDVTLRKRGEGGELVVRRGVCGGVEDTPKAGHQRRVPLVPPLTAALAAARGIGDAHVAVSAAGRPWGDYGLAQAFERVCERAEVSGWSFHSLRHYFVTSWLRKGVPPHVVQIIAGHENLATTQRYCHVTEGDLAEAARRVAGNMLVTPSPDAQVDQREVGRNIAK